MAEGDAGRRVGEHVAAARNTGFSGANVEIHAVAAAVELGDGATALARGDCLRIPDTVMRSRRGHHHIDLASAAMLHGDRNRALIELTHARRLTPEQTRYHPRVRELIATMATTDRRRTDGLSGLARWIGLTR